MARNRANVSEWGSRPMNQKWVLGCQCNIPREFSFSGFTLSAYGRATGEVGEPPGHSGTKEATQMSREDNSPRENVNSSHVSLDPLSGIVFLLLTVAMPSSSECHAPWDSTGKGCVL